MIRTALLVFLLIAIPAAAQTPATDVGAADRKAIRGVIESQIAAFRRDDGPGAFAFASPNIRRMFETPENFMTMVRRGYPEVYGSRAVAFGDLMRVEDTLLQLVDVVGPDGLPVLAVYEMERQPDGSWQIDGCQLLLPPERTS
jgi:hypothetical protein